MPAISPIRDCSADDRMADEAQRFSATHSDALSFVAVVVRRSRHKSIFNLRVDSVEPLLRALGFLPIGCDLCLQLSNPILGRVQLMRKLPSPI
jgi:hypothetical protein